MWPKTCCFYAFRKKKKIISRKSININLERNKQLPKELWSRKKEDQINSHASWTIAAPKFFLVTFIKQEEKKKHFERWHSRWARCRRVQISVAIIKSLHVAFRKLPASRARFPQLTDRWRHYESLNRRLYTLRRKKKHVPVEQIVLCPLYSTTQVHRAKHVNRSLFIYFVLPSFPSFFFCLRQPENASAYTCASIAKTERYNAVKDRLRVGATVAHAVSASILLALLVLSSTSFVTLSVD